MFPVLVVDSGPFDPYTDRCTEPGAALPVVDQASQHFLHDSISLRSIHLFPWLGPITSTTVLDLKWKNSPNVGGEQ